MIDPYEFDDMRARLEKRVKPSRYRHSLGVSQAAEQLARIYGADEDAAAVAGLLHDWDKALSFKELRKIAKKHKLAPKAVRKQMPGVLHALTAPYSLKKEFPGLSKEVLQAVSRHTCGAIDMTDLDKIVFIADIIEPGRTFSDVGPLRDAVGEVSLDELFFMTYGSTLVYLIEDRLPVHPDSLTIWNSLVAQREERLALEALEAALADEADEADAASEEDAAARQTASSDASEPVGELAQRAVAAPPAKRGPRAIIIQ